MPAGATYTNIATTTLASASNTVSFTSISNSYTDLLVVFDGFAATTSGESVACQFNSDNGSNYSYNQMSGTGTGVQSVINPTAQFPWLSGNYLGMDTSSSHKRNFMLHIYNYADTSYYKSAVAQFSAPSGVSPGTCITGVQWRNTAAITSIQIKISGTAQFAIGSIFTLFGIARA